MSSTSKRAASTREFHVLQICGNAIVGGMEKYVANLAQGLPAHGIKVSCLTPFESPFTRSLRRMDCETFVTPMDDNPTWRAIQFAAELIHSLNIDLVHAHLPRAHLLAGIAGRLSNRPVVATMHGLDILSIDISASRLTSSHLTVVCQQALLIALAAGVPASNLTYIANGVDLNLFTPNRDGDAFRLAQGIPLDVPLIGYIGRISYEKGPEFFVWLAEHIHKSLPNVHFVMAGDGVMRGEIEEMIAEAQMKDYIHLAGVCEEPWMVYPALDLVVQTSRVEGLPFALLEAMACGRPVAAFGVGGVPEVIEVGINGLLSAFGDWRGLANGIIGLLNDTASLRQMGVAARKRVEEGFNLKDQIRSMAALYRRLAAKGPAGGAWPGWLYQPNQSVFEEVFDESRVAKDNRP